MKTISQMFDSAFEVMQERKWEKIYVLVDIHQTILEPTWSDELSVVYYSQAKECLQMLSKLGDVCLIQWSSSSPDNNAKYHQSFYEDGIIFNYINYNPEVPSTYYADFDSKPYMNIIIDDKAGFEPSDWLELYAYLRLKNSIEKKHPQWVIDKFTEELKTYRK